MNDRLNESQRRIAERLDGMVVVDAGPGTGKTHTIVDRYVNLVSQEDVSPRDVLVLTFTNNAAEEMDTRIKTRMAEVGMLNESKLVQTGTFDAFCLSIVMDTPDQVGTLFGMKEKLTRGAGIVQNSSLNQDWFMSFLDDFLNRKGDDYGDWSAIGSQHQTDLLGLINRLMSRGIFPLKTGWFGLDWESQLRGCANQVLADMEAMNSTEGEKPSELAAVLRKLDPENTSPVPDTSDLTVPREALEESAFEDRSGLLRFIHDVYYDYIRVSIDSDRLTFGINAMLAFSLLYSIPSVRERNSYRYVMIDEFQDTNASQLMVALMILKEPNLCVVGDWKQGIYGFRYVSIENITDFEERTVALRRFLNDDAVRVPFQIPETCRLSLDTNYRSSSAIIDTAYRCLTLKGSKDDRFDEQAVLANVTPISAGRTDIGEDTAIRYVRCESKTDEAREVARAVLDYVGNGYTVNDGESRRPMRYGDIAVLCRNTKHCAEVMDALTASGIPAFLQGDVNIMATRQGKLALAWLRYINNEKDPWGYVPIMADLGYSLSEIKAVKDPKTQVPLKIRFLRQDLYQMRRRITLVLSTMFTWYGLNDDITQAIITILSSAHRGGLITISDLIRIIEEDIEQDTRYEVENSIETDAVTIMTMHKSKGLEFEAVIIPFVDSRTMPSTAGDSDVFSYSERSGIRCSLEVHDFDGYRKIVRNWRTVLVNASARKDYSEERRLMFVAMSRARQYETLICGPKASTFMTGLMDGWSTIPDADLPPAQELLSESNRPDISGYVPRKRHKGVHEIMRFDPEDGLGGMEDRPDEVSGKGREYGQKVHEAAQAMVEGRKDHPDYPELAMVQRVLDGIVKPDMLEAEMDCILPIDGPDIVLRGRMDLIAVFEDHVEIHDWKTDATKKYQAEYEIQLSVYANAAEQCYPEKPTRCYIQYLSLGETVEFEPLTIDAIRERVESILKAEDNR